MGQIVGQVELQVVPNDQNFNRDLQRIIDKASTGANTNIKPTIDTSGVEAAAAKLTQSATAAAEQATQALSGISPDMDTRQFEAAAAQIEAAAEQSSGRASDSFQKIAIGVGIAAAAMYGLKQASDVVVGSLSKLFDNLLKAQAGFEAILGQAEGNKLLADIQEFARVTPFSTEGLVQYSQQLLGVGRSAESIIPTLSSVGDLVASKGGDTQTINRVLFTLTQIQSVGRLIGQDALQLQSALIPITKLLADSMGKTQAEIKKLSAAGKISADTVFKTLEEAGLDVAGAMEGATRNIGGAKEGLLDTVTILGQKSPVLQALNADIVQAIKNLTEFVGSDRVAELATELGESLETLYKSMQPIFSQLSAVSGEAILTLLEAVTPLISVLGATISAIPVPVLTAIGALLAFSKFQTFISGFGKVVDLFQNFQGLAGRVAAGLGQTTRALQTERLGAIQTSAVNANLAASYNTTAASARTATAATNQYTASLNAQRLAAQQAAAAEASASTGRLSGLKAGASRALAPGGAGGAALGAAGFIGLSQRDNVDGGAGQALGVASTTATAAALGAQVGGPYGAAIGAAAGLGFGIFQEFNKKAREDAAAKAEEWGEIGAESAKRYSEEFAKNFSVDVIPGEGGPAATGTERARQQAQDAADLILLKDAAAGAGVLTPEIQAAADRLNITLPANTTRIQVGANDAAQAQAFIPGLENVTPQNLGGNGGNPLPGQQAQIDPLLLGPGQSLFEFEIPGFDQSALGSSLKEWDEQFDAINNERAKKVEITNSLLQNELSRGFFDNSAFSDIDLTSTTAEIEAANTEVIGSVTDQLQKFNIPLDEALKKADKLAFYFSDILKNVQGSVDESTQWNLKLEEAKTTLDEINKERLKEASARLGLLNQEEEFTKKIANINADTDPKAAAQVTIDALKIASEQAAQQGGTLEEIAARQNQLFSAYIKDIQEQGSLTEEQLTSILESVGLADDFTIASEAETERVTFLNTEIERLTNQLRISGPAGAAAIQQRIDAYEDEKNALQGVSTEESRAQAARDLRNANALGLVKANEALVKTYNDIGVAVLLGETSLSQFGDAAQQAFGLAQAEGEDAAEKNQLFVDSLENIQLVYGYTDQELKKYLDSVGLLDAYNKSLIDSNVGVGTTVDDLSEQYGHNITLVRELLGLVDDVSNDVTIYINADTQAALANLQALRQEALDVQNDPALSGAEKFQERRRLGAQYQQGLDDIKANGGDANATVGALTANERRIREQEAEKAQQEADRAAKDAEAAAKRLQDSINSASNTLQNAIESAAQAVENAAEAWKSDIKQRVEYEQAVSVGRLTSNTDRQSRDLEELTSGLDSLRSRGVSDEVLQALGIDNVGDLRQVRKLVKSNDSDLAKLTEAVSKRDSLALGLAQSEEDKRTRDNITAAIIAAATALGIDVSKDRAAQISNQFNIAPGVDGEGLTNAILGLLSGGKISR